MMIEITNRAVGKNETHIEPNKRTTAPKHETHETADRTVFLDAVPIINPDDRQVLRIVKDLEQCDAGKNVRDAVVTVPPKHDARCEECELDRIMPSAGDPHSDIIRYPQNGHRNCRD